MNIEKQNIEKAWLYLIKAQNEVSVRFTGHKETDKIIRKAYNEIEKLKEELRNLIEKLEI